MKISLLTSQQETSQVKNKIYLTKSTTLREFFLILQLFKEKVLQEKHTMFSDVPCNIVYELWDSFDPAVIGEIIDLQYAFSYKSDTELTFAEQMCARMSVIEYFEDKGYSLENIQTFLPIQFIT